MLYELFMGVVVLVVLVDAGNHYQRSQELHSVLRRLKMQMIAERIKELKKECK